MNTIFSIEFWSNYMLPSAVSLAVFYLIYKIFVGKDTHFQVRRFSILGILVFSMVLPFLNFQIPTNVTIGNVETWRAASLQTISELPLFTVFGDGVVVENIGGGQTPPVQPFKIIGWIYLLIVAILLGRGIVGLLHLAMFSRNGNRLKKDNETIVSCSKIPTAFSFFTTIFIPETQFSEQEKEMMLAHERVHVYQKHSWDLMLMNVICAVQFFNPFVWLLKYEMRLNHEFLADKGALKNTDDSEKYFSLLLQKIVVGRHVERSRDIPSLFVHPFHYSPLKHRLMMQISKPAKMLNQVRYLVLIPVALALTFLFACQEKSTFLEDILSSENTELTITSIELSEKHSLSIEEIRVFCQQHDIDTLIMWNEYANATFLYVRSTDRITRDDKTTTQEQAREKYGPITTGNTIWADLKNWLKNKEKDEKSIEFTNTSEMLDHFSDPLYFIDGKEVSKDFASNIDANEIESVTVWKGSSLQSLEAVALVAKYGERVKERGVIEIIMKKTTDNCGCDPVFIVVDENPQFPGGDEARMEFLRNNIRYPAEARNNNIQGTVFAQFVIKADGSLCNIEIVRGIGGGTDEEVIRILETMPNWIPGQQRGQNVCVQFIMPVRFTLGG
jgi:TonB family protein